MKPGFKTFHYNLPFLPEDARTVTDKMNLVSKDSKYCTIEVKSVFIQA